MAASTLGAAYVEVHADMKPFAKEVKKDIEEVLKKLDSTVLADGITVGRTLGTGIGRGLEQTTDTNIRTFGQRVRAQLRQISADAASDFSSVFRRLATSNFLLFRILGNTAERLGDTFKTIKNIAKAAVEVGKAFFNVGRALFDLTTKVGQVGLEGLLDLLGNLGDTAGQLSGALVSLAASAAAGGVGLIAMAAAAIFLVGALSALAAILVTALAPFVSLLGFAALLPAAFSILAAVIAPLTISLRQLGDALELVFEKDPKKLEKGLKELSPTMRSLALSLRTIAPLLTRLQNVVQKSFFGPIMAALLPAIKKITPELTRGLEMVGRTMGTFVANALSLLNSPVFRQFIHELFPAVSRMIETLAPPLIHLMSALTTAATAALPTAEDLVTTIADLIERFATWIEDTVADGRFQDFLDDAIESAKEIKNLGKEILGILLDMFGETDEGGKKFLARITEALNKFREWLKSPEGKEALENAVLQAQAFAVAFGIALAAVTLIVTKLGIAVKLMTKLLELTGVIEDKNKGGGGGLKFAPGGFIPQFQGGGVVGHDQIALVHRGEPILDPANSVSKNRSILAEAGMLDVLGEDRVINVYIGANKIDSYVDSRFSRGQRQLANAITYSSRKL